MLKPQPPFDTWPIHFVDQKSKVFAWFIEPCTFVLQYQMEHYDLKTAEVIVRLIDGARAACDAAIRANNGYLTIQDMRAVKVIDKDAQQLLEKAWKTLSPKDLRGAYMVAGPTMGVFSRVAINTLNIVSAFRTGKTMNFMPDVESALNKFNIVAPPAGVKFPGTL